MYASLLTAAVSPLAPLTDLHAPELHAAEVLGLTSEQVGRLAAVCTDYTATAVSLAERSAALGTQASALIESPEIHETSTQEAVRVLLAKRREVLGELDDVFLAHWLTGLGHLSPDQIEVALELRRAESVRMVRILAGGGSPVAVP